MSRKRSLKLTGKSYASVQEMIDATLSPEYADNFRRYSAERDVVRQFVVRRAAAGLTIEDVAAKLGWSDDSVEDLETSRDRHLRLEDVKKYADAIGCIVTIQEKP